MGKIVKGGIEYGGAPLPIASSQVVGGVKVGNGLSIAPDGTLSAQGGGGGASSLGQLSDVELSDLYAGETIVYDDEEEKFVNRSLELDDLDGVYVNGAENGQVLTCQGNGRWRAQNVSSPYGFHENDLSILWVDGTTPSSPIVRLSNSGWPSSGNLAHMMLELKPGITFSDGTHAIQMNGAMNIPITITRSSGTITSVSDGNLDAVPVYGSYLNNPALFFVKGVCSLNSVQGLVDVTLELQNHITIFDADNSAIITIPVSQLESATKSAYSRARLFS